MFNLNGLMAILPFYALAVLALALLIGIMTYFVTRNRADGLTMITAPIEAFMYGFPIGVLGYVSGSVLRQSSDQLAGIIAAGALLVLAASMISTLRVEHCWKPLVMITASLFAAMLILGLQQDPRQI